MMSNEWRENWERRERWIEERFRELGWSERELKRGERYRRSGEYILVGVVWTLLLVPAPIGLSMILYGGYLRVRYGDLGERYVRRRRDLNREFSRRSNGSPDAWSVQDERWTDRLPIPDRS